MDNTGSDIDTNLAYNCGGSGEDESESLDPRLAVLSHLVEIKGNKIPK